MFSLSVIRRQLRSSWKRTLQLMLVFLLIYICIRNLLCVYRHISSDITLPVGSVSRPTPTEEYQVKILQSISAETHQSQISDYVDSLRTRRQSDKTFEPFYIPRAYKVTMFNHAYSIDGHSICEGSVPFLLIIVPSLYDSTLKRKEIRETFGSVTKTGVWADGLPLAPVKLVFFIGHGIFVKNHNQLYEESFTHGDIVFADFIDSYRNLTTKMMVAMNWVSTYCSATQYVLKVDHDTIVHLPRLIRLLRKVNSSNAFFGRQARNLTVMRESSKWMVSTKEYPLNTYPPYIIGMFYVFPGHLAGKLFEIAQYLPHLPIEDVFITGILRTVVGAELKDLRRYVCLSPRKCSFLEANTIATTGFKGYFSLKTMWEHLTRLTKQRATVTY